MNLPNKLTVGRIVLIFIFVILANIEKNGFVMHYFHFLTDDIVMLCHRIGFIIAIIAGVTDFFDGWIARRYNLVTDFGKLMDPLADKILIVATFIVLCSKTTGDMPSVMPSWIAIVVISREFLVTGLRVLAGRKGEVIAADRWGKLKTLLQMLMLIIGGCIWVQWLPLGEGTIWSMIWNLILWTIVFITVSSGVGYFYKYRHLYMEDS